MTNAQIIMNESVRLLEEGILKGTGNMLTMKCIDQDGNEFEKQIEEPEQIHTYAIWKQLGRQVKKGQKAVTTIVIWKHVNGKKNEETGEEAEAKMFMKKSSFFTIDQTEPITH